MARECSTELFKFAPVEGWVASPVMHDVVDSRTEQTFTHAPAGLPEFPERNFVLMAKHLTVQSWSAVACMAYFLRKTARRSLRVPGRCGRLSCYRRQPGGEHGPRG